MDQTGLPTEEDHGAILLNQHINGLEFRIHYSRPRQGNCIIKRIYRAPAHCLSRLDEEVSLRPHMTVCQRIQFVMDNGGTLIRTELVGDNRWRAPIVEERTETPSQPQSTFPRRVPLADLVHRARLPPPGTTYLDLETVSAQEARVFQSLVNANPPQRPVDVPNPFRVDSQEVGVGPVRERLEEFYRRNGSRLPSSLRTSEPPSPSIDRQIELATQELAAARARQRANSAATYRLEDLSDDQVAQINRLIQHHAVTPYAESDNRRPSFPSDSEMQAFRELFRNQVFESAGVPVHALGVVADTGPTQENPYEWEGGTVALFDEAHEKDGRHSSDTPIFSWEIQSTRVSRTGRSPKYVIVLYADGCASCDCPGWVYKRPNKDRGCKHIDSMAAEIQETHRQHLRGEPLEVLPDTPLSVPETAPRQESGGPVVPAPRYGRVIDLD